MSDFYAQPGRDGRRKSNPLRVPHRSVDLAPSQVLYRLVTAADGAEVLTNEGLALNFRGYLQGNFQVVPLLNPAQIESDTPQPAVASNPAVDVLFWNPHTKSFVEANPAITRTGAGAGVPYEFSIPVDGQQVLVRVTSGFSAGEAVAIFASGADVNLEI